MGSDYLKKSFLFLLCLLLPITAASGAEKLDHIEKLFSIRASITSQDEALPSLIQKTSGNDLRTLERLYEINASTLTTIEAYFRILMIALSNNDQMNKETIDILNEWLDFMRNQSKYDKQFFETTIKDTSNEDVRSQIKLSTEITKSLLETTDIGVAENVALLKK